MAAPVCRPRHSGVAVKVRPTLSRLRLVLAALRWRALSSTIMVAVGAAAVFAAASGPIYVHAADQSILDARLLAGAPGTGLTIIPSGSQPLRSLRRATSAVPKAPSGAAAFGRPIVSTDVEVTTVSTRDGQPFVTDLVSRTGVCGYLHVISGTCPRRPGQVALSDRSARALGLKVGRQLVLEPPRSSPVRLSVVAVFRADNGQAPQWWGQNPFGFGAGTPSLPRLDDVFAAQSTVTGTMPARAISYVAQLPLVEGALPVSGIDDFTDALAHYSTRVVRSDGVHVSSDLARAVAQSAADQHTMTTIIAVVDVQLVLLALLVLYFVAARTAEAREPEVRLAGLRGFRRSGTASVALFEPVLLLCVSLPLGLAGAWLAARLAGSHLYPDGVVPSLTLPALGIAVATFAAAVAATAIGVRRLIGDGRRVRRVDLVCGAGCRGRGCGRHRIRGGGCRRGGQRVSHRPPGRLCARPARLRGRGARSTPASADGPSDSAAHPRFAMGGHRPGHAAGGQASGTVTADRPDLAGPRSGRVRRGGLERGRPQPIHPGQLRRGRQPGAHRGRPSRCRPADGRAPGRPERSPGHGGGRRKRFRRHVVGGRCQPTGCGGLMADGPRWRHTGDHRSAARTRYGPTGDAVGQCPARRRRPAPYRDAGPRTASNHLRRRLPDHVHARSREHSNPVPINTRPPPPAAARIPAVWSISPLPGRPPTANRARRRRCP